MKVVEIFQLCSVYFRSIGYIFFFPLMCILFLMFSFFHVTDLDYKHCFAVNLLRLAFNISKHCHFTGPHPM